MVVGESRTELLQWLNLTLDLNYTKVEQCGTGAAFCQLLDSIVGGIPMMKVRFDAKTEYDYRHNWKILQGGFTKHKITKIIDVERLIKCRLQDNLELLQWFKRYWAENKDYNDDSYDPASKRRVSGSTNSTGSASVSGRRNVLSSTTGTVAPPPKPMSRQRTSSRSSLTGGVSGGGGAGGVAANTSRSRLTETPLARSSSQNFGLNTSNSSMSTPSLNYNKPNPQQNSRITQLTKQVDELSQENAQLMSEAEEYRISSESLVTERNFYFNKLRDIEIVCQHIQELNQQRNLQELGDLDIVKFSSQILDICYQTEEGFGDVEASMHEISNISGSSMMDESSVLGGSHHNGQHMSYTDDMLDGESF
ncbi:BIM1 [[Candida] subhashii]|uniref:BIM1 n=1 Tax=[Candida] subhashii TaxID=561895 RepID=A0A8J5UVQ0_9ASCO|nr:BIM1 [[Candida] subhashii]KAG7662375.1 BIM1 [[Candida] subhashii]